MWTSIVLAAAFSPQPIDFVANPQLALGRRPEVRAGSTKPGRVLQRAEVAILEGDETIVTVQSPGAYRLSGDAGNNDRVDIAQRFFSRYPDEFDQLIVFLTFPDFASIGASAYYARIKNDASGIAIPVFDQSATYGSMGALQGFVNMHTVWQYGQTVEELSDPGLHLYATLAQEFSHRWLAHLLYEDAGGFANPGMLGRDGTHWSALLDAEGSVQDGYDWVDNGDGSFTSTARMTHFSPLDLYGMGLLAAGDVPPWFLIEDATLADGTTPVVATDTPALGTVVLGTRLDLTIDDVVAANGARVPDAASAQQSFRLAFVLLTHPGQTADLVQQEAEKVDAIRRTWEEQAYPAMAGGLGQMCTRLSAPCGAPGARPVEVRVDDSGDAGNGNGILEPGESGLLTVGLVNDGGTAADSVHVAASFDVAGIDSEPVTATAVAPGAQLRASLATTVAKDLPCGQTATVEIESTVGDSVFRGAFWTDIGVAPLVRETFETESGWAVDPDGTDSATAGAFERGEPEASGAPVVVQPGEDRTGDGFSFVTGAAAGAEAEDGDLDGETTLVSPAWDLSDALDPVLRFDVWFVAFGLTAFSGAEDPLIVEASANGEEWEEIDRLELPALEWMRREIPLDDFVSTATRVRFRAGDRGGDDVVEVLIDDVQVRGLTEACIEPAGMEPPPGEQPAISADGGCGCATAARPSGAGAASALLALGLALAIRHGRARTPSRPQRCSDT